MSQRVKDHTSVLRRLVSCSKQKRKQILLNADAELIKTISEIALNTLNSNVELSDDQFKKLCRHKNTLRDLADKRVSVKKKKKKILRQAGGFLLPLLIPILTSVLTSAL
jgi:hypothetical protein